MPSFNIHLAVANRYMEKHNIQNKEDFLTGNVAPDFMEKSKSHYSIILENATLIEDLKNKVVIEKFLKENKVETDYEKGVFLHLITDKLFFTNFFEKEYLNKVEKEAFRKNLYYSYHKTNDYLMEKYHIQFPKKYEKEIKEVLKEKNMQKETLVIDNNKLDNFIEEVSNINLEEYIKTA